MRGGGYREGERGEHRRWGDWELKGSMHSKPIIGSISEPRAAD